MKKHPLRFRTKFLSNNTRLSSHLFFEQLRYFEYKGSKPVNLVHSKETADQKDAIVYRQLALLLQKFPSHLDESLLKSYSRLQAFTTNDFFEERPLRHLMRLVCSHYFIYKELARSLRLFPEERHLSFRLMQTRLEFPFGTKFVLGLAIGICLLNEYELFSEKHILMAIQHLIPSVVAVHDSFYISQQAHDHIRLFYLEVEKSDGSRFSLSEIRRLKCFLASSFKTRVEKLFPALFMTRNEEEIMKTILILGQELRHQQSLPQVVISFDSQSTTELFFSVIIVHLIRTPDHSFRKIVLDTDTCTWTTNRIQLVDHLEDKSAKEAVVFHVRMKKNDSLLRADFSINFYLARQQLVQTLQGVFGQIRDYNGGLIVQQGKRLSEFKHEFSQERITLPELLENFFYSLTPIETQATIEQTHLKKLFSLCLESIKTPLPKRESYFFKTETEEKQTFVMVRIRDLTIKDCFLNALSSFETRHPLISTTLSYEGCYLFGYIFTRSATCSKEEFIAVIEQAISKGVEKVSSLRSLRLAFPNLPVSLDPRIGGDAYSSTVLKMLFEGLMRYGDDGELTYGLCQSVDISSDAKTYTFHLRKSVWSNGSPVTSHDFAYAWKKVLSPDFYTPFAYLFYPIKHAKLVKEGKKPLDLLGIYPANDNILVIELEYPIPYFLELTALSLYSPVPHTLNNVHSNWAQQVGENYVCNGPFQLMKKSRSQGIIELTTNPLYWDPKLDKPDQISIIQSNAQTALQMFKNNELDWIGSPLQDWNPHLLKNIPTDIESIISSGVFWAIFNVQRFPFHNTKLRQAFSYAIDRKKLAETLAYDGLPALSPLPIMHSQVNDITFLDDNKQKALQLFHEALHELGLTKFPSISFVCSEQDNFLNAVVQLVIKRWKQLFDIDCRVEQHRYSAVFDRITQGDFQVGFICWEAWVDDPIYTLNAFKYEEERMNLSKWENRAFQKLLDEADQTLEKKQRKTLLSQAEAILIAEAPIVPLLYEVQQFSKKSYVHVPCHKNTGKFSFRSTLISQNPSNTPFKSEHL